MSSGSPAETATLCGRETSQRPVSKDRCSCGWMWFEVPPPGHCLNKHCPHFRPPTFGWRGD